MGSYLSSGGHPTKPLLRSPDSRFMNTGPYYGHLKQISSVVSKNQALQILCLKHHARLAYINLHATIHILGVSIYHLFCITVQRYIA